MKPKSVKEQCGEKVCDFFILTFIYITIKFNKTINIYMFT